MTKPSLLLPLSPVQQLRAGRMGRRLPQLVVGLVLYGVSLAVQLRGALGLSPWDVLTQGIERHVPLSFGTITIVTAFVVLLLWIPLRQAPGLGTVLNAVIVGLAVDLGLWLLPHPEGLLPRIGFLVSGVVLNGLATAIYVGAQLGPGPRDGLMTGLHRVTGRSLRLVRTGIEVTVLTLGWLLGGQVGLGTVLYALAVGPLFQFFLPFTVVRLDPPQLSDSPAAPHR